MTATTPCKPVSLISFSRDYIFRMVEQNKAQAETRAERSRQLQQELKQRRDAEAELQKQQEQKARSKQAEVRAGKVALLLAKWAGQAPQLNSEQAQGAFCMPQSCRYPFCQLILLTSPQSYLSHHQERQSPQPAMVIFCSPGQHFTSQKLLVATHLLLFAAWVLNSYCS